MIKPLITRLFYTLFDISKGGKLSKYYKAAKDANKQHKAIPQEALESYLSKWGFNSQIEKNPLMDKPALKEWIAKVDETKVKSWAYTGGSYGEPFRVPYSAARDLMRTGTFRYFNEVGGYRLGDPFVIIRAKKRPALMKFLRNEMVFIPNDISEPKIASFVNDLEKEQVKLILGYPTVMYELALYLQKHPEKVGRLGIKAMISVSEPLEDHKKAVIHSVMKCSYVDRYSNEEVGLIAQQEAYGQEYFVNKFGVYVEVVNAETLLPVKEGEIGKVVVTDIFNDLVPVVRYDTGDLAIAHKYENGQLLSIKGIVGRVTETIKATDGNPISPLIMGPYIYKPLSQSGHALQYQFAQTGGKQYELRLKVKPGQLPEPLLQQIKNDLLGVLGAGALLDIVFVDDIKPQPSGKRPVFKNEMK